MKKIIFALLIIHYFPIRRLIGILLLSTLFITNCYAQWQGDVRLTNDTFYSYTSDNNAWCIASNENFVHVVWSNQWSSYSQIYYKHSTNGGVNWGEDMRLINNSVNSYSPATAVSGQSVHVVWSDQRTAYQGIYYKSSTDGGANWGADLRLTYDNSDSYYPSIAVSGQNVHVVWQEKIGSNNYEVYYVRSTNGGVNWDYVNRLTNNLAYSGEASIAVSGQMVNVVWHDARDGNYEIYAKHSQDGGASWGADSRLTNNSAYSYSPSIAMSGQIVHVVWEDYRDGNFEIYYKRSTDGGNSWGADTRLTDNSAASEGPSISVSGQLVHIVWHDYRDGHTEIYYKRSTDGGFNWEADTRLTNKTSYSTNPSVSASAQSVHVVWFDDRDVRTEIYYKLNPTGNITGINSINSKVPEEYSLSQNYPNPFNPVTKIRFDIPSNVKRQTANVKLIVYDILGQEITTLVNEQLQPGTYEVTFDGSNLPSGVYFYRILSGDFSGIKKLLLVK